MNALEKAVIAHDHSSHGHTKPGSHSYNMAIAIRNNAMAEYAKETGVDDSHGGSDAWRDFWAAVEERNCSICGGR